MAPAERTVEQPDTPKSGWASKFDPRLKFLVLLIITLFFSMVFRLLLDIETASDLIKRPSFFNFSFDILILSVGVLLGSNTKSQVPAIAIMVGLVASVFLSVLVPKLWGVDDWLMVIVSCVVALVVYFLTVLEA